MKIINSKKAPKPIGPYNQAILAGNTLYCSGQIALDPATGELLQSGIAEETTRVMQNISVVLQEADMTFENVVKCSIFLSDMALFAQVNEVYGKYFSSNPPARETVAVKELPKKANVEISVIAVK